MDMRPPSLFSVFTFYFSLLQVQMSDVSWTEGTQNRRPSLGSSLDLVTASPQGSLDRAWVIGLRVPSTLYSTHLCFPERPQHDQAGLRNSVVSCAAPVSELQYIVKPFTGGVMDRSHSRPSSCFFQISNSVVAHNHRSWQHRSMVPLC